MRYFLAIVLFCLLSGLQAQKSTVSGMVKDSLALPLQYASVKLKWAKDSIAVSTNKKGEFVFKDIDFGSYLLSVSFIGYGTITRQIECNQSAVVVDDLLLQVAMQTTAAITVNAVVATKLKGDTVVYNANAFKTNPDAVAEDLLKKMPGVNIEGGVLKAQGEDVKKILIDGKPFFGDDVNAALKNIGVDMIARVEIFDQWSDQAIFTGFDDGQAAKTINIITKKNMKDGNFAKLYAGYGDNQGRYQAGLNYNHFNNYRRFTLLAMSNNINQTNFSMQDLTAATGSSSPPMILGRAGGPNNASNPVNNFMVGGMSGLNFTNAGGLNYTDMWGTKIKFTASYFFNRVDNENKLDLSRQYYSSSDTVPLYHENNSASSIAYNHKANVRFEYFVDSLNSIIATPSFSAQSNDALSNLNGLSSKSTGELLNQSINHYASKSLNSKLVNEILYRHRFEGKRRTISFILRDEWNTKNVDYSLKANNTYYTNLYSDTLDQQSAIDGPIQNHSLALNYTEPYKKHSHFLFNYKGTINTSNSAQRTNTYDAILKDYSAVDSALTNDFQNKVLTHLLGLGYRINVNKITLSVGADYQNSFQSNQQFQLSQYNQFRTYQNILPNAMFRVNFSKKFDWRLTVRTRVDMPSLLQLQEVWNNSNPILLSVGNPSLKAQYAMVTYNKITYNNPVNAHSIMLFVMFRKINHYISNSTSVLAADTLISGNTLVKGTRYTQPINVDGYWNSRIYLVYGSPLKKLKSNLNLTTGYFSSTTPTLVNNLRGISNSYSVYESVSLSSNISENLDFSISTTANYNVVNNSLQSSANYNYFNLNSSAKLTWRFFKGMIFQSEINNTLFTGISSSFSQNYFLWNASLAQKLFKDGGGELKFLVFDALQQNNSVSRNVTDTYVDDSSNLVLQRYFMVMFTYKIKKLKSVESKD